MAFTDAEKAQIRKWLGFPALFHYRDPRLESAIHAVEVLADGGATEEQIRGLLAKLAAVETAIDEVAECVGTVKVNGVEVDQARAQLLHERRGRRYVGQLSVALGFGGWVMRDPFAPAKLQPGADALVNARPLGGWSR